MLRRVADGTSRRAADGEREEGGGDVADMGSGGLFEAADTSSEGEVGLKGLLFTCGGVVRFGVEDGGFCGAYFDGNGALASFMPSLGISNSVSLGTASGSSSSGKIHCSAPKPSMHPTAPSPPQLRKMLR